MQQRLRVDGDIFGNAARMDADNFDTDKKDAFSKISGYVWMRPQSNDTLLHFVEFSNVHNCDRSSNATRSKLVYKNV